jgi:hypothetical protein
VIRHFILLLLVCGICSFAAYDSSAILPDTVFVEDSKVVNNGFSRCGGKVQSCTKVSRGCRAHGFYANEKADGEKSEDFLFASVYGSHSLLDSSLNKPNDCSDAEQKENLLCEKVQSNIVVSRGCREEHFTLDEFVDASESEESLLARVYGSEPLQDSSGIYRQWASNCKKEETRRKTGVWLHAFLAGGLCTAAGIGLLSIDYEHTATKVLGKGLGWLYLVSGIAFLSVDIVAPIVWLFKSPSERVQKYEERENAWKLRVAPAINFSEPGGGLLLQLGF